MPSNRLRCFMVAAASMSLIAASPAVRDSEPPAGRLSKAVVPTQYRIELTIDPSRKSFSGKVEIDVQLNGPQDAVWMHGKNLDVSEAYLMAKDSGRIEASYAERLESGVSLVSFSRTAASGPATLHFAYTAPFNESANALYRIERDDEHYAITQFQAIAARQVFPGFDEPGFKAPFDLAVIARKGDAVITTTSERSAQDLGDGRIRHVFSRTRPLPTYLLAFAVGPYDVVDYGLIPVNAIRSREVPLRGVAAGGQGARMTYALRNTNGMLTLLEKYFGSGYPFEKLDLIAVPESFGGAMENVGAITYDEYFLLMDDDAPLGQRRSHTSLHAHELAHMWFGNLVTPAWWNDIWLNESFASWMQYKIAQQHWPEGEFSRSTLKSALGAMWSDSLAAARKIREPIEENDEIDGAFDSITYSKGGGVLSMLERYVGKAGFQAGVRLHIERHKDGTATSEDFIDSLVKGSGRPEITGAFLSYIEQPGIPLLSVKVDCVQGREAQLRVRQTRYAPLGSAIQAEGNRWQIPFCAALTVDGARMDRCELLSEREQIVALDNQTCPTMVHPNADGMGYYRFAMDDAGWRALVDGAAAINPAEALTFADSLDAAFRAGVVSADFYVTGMAALAAHDAWDVADSVTGYLEDITEILDPSQLPAVEAAFREIALPRFASLIEASDAGSVLFRRRLQRFLTLVAKDEGMRALLAEKAAAIIGLHGDAFPSAAPADEYETIFSVGVQDLGEPYFDLLLKQALASQDAVFRDAALGALARAEDPVLAKQLQAAVLAGEVKGVDMVGVIFRQMAWPATMELTFAWIRENDRAIIAKVPEAFRSYAIPQLGGSFCSTARAADWRAFVESHAERLPGYERDLAQATESIQLCAALKQASGANLAAALARLPGQAVTNPRNGSVGR